MLRIRKVADATTAVNRSAIEAAQKIMREQFPAMPDYDIAKRNFLGGCCPHGRDYVWPGLYLCAPEPGPSLGSPRG